MFLKPDAVGIITRAGYRMGIVSLLRDFNDWRIWDGLAKLFMPVMHLAGVPNVKSDGFWSRDN